VAIRDLHLRLRRGRLLWCLDVGHDLVLLGATTYTDVFPSHRVATMRSWTVASSGDIDRSDLARLSVLELRRRLNNPGNLRIE
jgi:hypothetical protein